MGMLSNVLGGQQPLAQQPMQATPRPQPAQPQTPVQTVGPTSGMTMGTIGPSVMPMNGGMPQSMPMYNGFSGLFNQQPYAQQPYMPFMNRPPTSIDPRQFNPYQQNPFMQYQQMFPPMWAY